MIDSQSPHPRVGAWARRSVAASPGTKATCLGTGRVDHAAWPMPSLRARRLGINHLAGRLVERRGDAREPLHRVAAADDDRDLLQLARAPPRRELDVRGPPGGARGGG